MSSNLGAVYWMDMTFFTLICCKNCIVCLKRPKINEKEAGIGPFVVQLRRQETINWFLALSFYVGSLLIEYTD